MEIDELKRLKKPRNIEGKKFYFKKTGIQMFNINKLKDLFLERGYKLREETFDLDKYDDYYYYVLG